MLGAIGAIPASYQVGLKLLELMIEFGPYMVQAIFRFGFGVGGALIRLTHHTFDRALSRFGFGVGDALIRLAHRAFDPRIGRCIGLISVLLCACELNLHATKLLLDVAARAAEDILSFGLGAGDPLVRLRLDSGDPLVRLRLDSCDPRIGIGLCPVGMFPGPHQLVPHQSELLPDLGRLLGDATVDIALSSVDTRVSVSLNLHDGGSGVGSESLDEPIGFVFKLVDPVARSPQLGRQLVRQRHGAVAILVGQVHRLLSLGGLASRHEVTPPRRILTVTHDAHDDTKGYTHQARRRWRRRVHDGRS